MRFSEYMNEWLYGVEGYYSQFHTIGKDGDFYTAVSTSPFFGAAIANFLCQKVSSGQIPRDVTLVEIGAHRGYLIADMIQWIFTCDSTLLESMRFVIIERQESVRRAQQEYLWSRFGDEVSIEQAESLDDLDLEYAFFVSNEIFDAFPCDLYIDGKIADVVENAILWKDARQHHLDHASRYGMQKGEIAVGYEDFASKIVSAVKNFDFVSFDYGDRYARNDFSIRIYKEHKVYPFFDDGVELDRLFGHSDITYDVNFSHLIDAFESAGASLVSLEKQGRALVRFGIIDLLEQYAKVSTQAQYLHEADKIKTLIAPNVMGERFKMVHFSK